MSLSSITREQRQVTSTCGQHGYGYFETYFREYLSKLRSARRAILRRWKPYDVEGSARRSLRSRSSSFSIDDRSHSSTAFEDLITETTKRSFLGSHVKDSCRKYRNFSREGRDSRRTLSESSRYSEADYRSERRHHSESDYHSERRRYSSSDYQSEGRRYSESEYSSRHRSESGYRSRHSSDSYALVPRRSSWSDHSDDEDRSRNSSRRRLSSSLAERGSVSRYVTRFSGLPRPELYKIWEERRQKYMIVRYSSSPTITSAEFSKSLILSGFTCGICYKSFATRISLEQHSEEVMHFACVTCGKFFASHTALGQHAWRLGHRKD